MILFPVPDRWKPTQKYVAKTIKNRLHNCLCNDRNTAMKWVTLGKFHSVVYNAIVMPFCNFKSLLDFQIGSKHHQGSNQL